MIHGFLNIDKERGCTSHHVVAQIRRILHQAEVGHTGTLDPEATGVLVVGLGQATRFFSFLNENIKVYRAELIFGLATDTQDITGKVLTEKTDTDVDEVDLNRCIAALTGEIAQMPPMYSAVKVQGRKLYELARQGIEIDRLPRLIQVHQWRILNPASRYACRDTVSCEITCSKGTYIRTLIDDLGKALGCGACMGRLTRLKSGIFSLENAVTVTGVKELFEQGLLNEILISPNLALGHLPPLWVGTEDLVKVRNGGKLSYGKYPVEAETARVLDRESRVVAIVQRNQTENHSYWQPVKVFSMNNETGDDSSKQ